MPVGKSSGKGDEEADQVMALVQETPGRGRAEKEEPRAGEKEPGAPGTKEPERRSGGAGETETGVDPDPTNGLEQKRTEQMLLQELLLRPAPTMSASESSDDFAHGFAKISSLEEPLEDEGSGAEEDVVERLGAEKLSAEKKKRLEVEKEEELALVRKWKVRNLMRRKASTGARDTDVPGVSSLDLPHEENGVGGNGVGGNGGDHGGNGGNGGEESSGKKS